jgi:hypothetical protein
MKGNFLYCRFTEGAFIQVIEQITPRGIREDESRSKRRIDDSNWLQNMIMVEVKSDCDLV